MDTSLIVNELFVSIQGESTRAGRVCGFVRLTGCPLRCRWCDTVYAYEEGRPMAQEEVLAWVGGAGVGLVEVTGGEPLAQAATPALLSALCDAGLEVMLETSGALDIGPVDPRVGVIMDIKCPSSGMADRMHWPNLERLGTGHEVKLALADRADYDYAKAILEEHGLARRTEVLFSPVWGRLEPRRLAEWMIADRLPVRLQLQLHKLLWDPSARGV